MMRYTEQSSSTMPAAVPVSLEVRHVSVPHLLSLLGVVGLLLAVAVLFGVVGAWLVERVPAAALLLWVAVLASLGVAALLLWLVGCEVLARVRHHEMVAAWHDAALARYESGAADAVQSRAVTLELSADNTMHLLAVACYLHQRIMCGASPSVRVLAGPMFLGGRRVGDLSKEDAQHMLNRLAAAGLIAGRGSRSAGAWLAGSYSEVVGVLLDNQRLHGGESDD